MDKICGICHQDCSDKPRVKDSKGRYFCKACAMDRVKAPAEPHLPEPDPPEEDVDPYDLDSALPSALIDTARQAKQCPACAHSMAPDAKICIACGYNEALGIQSSTQVERTASKDRSKKRAHQCRECGYELTGLRSGVCPECGTRIKRTRDQEREETARQVMRDEWRKPGIYFAIGAAGLALFYTATGMPEALVGYSLLLAVQIVVGYAVLWLCFNFIGDVGTPLLNLARLASIYVMVDLVSVFVAFIPIFIIPLVIKVLVYIGLFADAFDTDWQDAFLVIALTWFAKFALFLVAVLYLPDLFA